jgi:hypothetical protein
MTLFVGWWADRHYDVDDQGEWYGTGPRGRGR